ncbi:unnamed protein product [Rotaria socialis]|nr:unnamed protein product [Rotaria socialis]
MGNGSHCPSQSCNQLLSIEYLTPNPPPRLVVSMLDKLKVRCQLCNETNINRGIFDEHVKTSCSEYRIDCPGKNIGCQWFGSRNEHDEHTKTCLFEKLRPVVDILYKIIENQSLDIKEQKAQLEQQKAQLQQQQIQIGDIQSENQTQKNETASIRKQITTLDEEMNKLRSAIHQLSK